MDSPKILVTGATGYIGGTILNHLLTTKPAALKSAKYSVVIRNPFQATLFEPLGVEAIVLQNQDDPVALRKIASSFDIVINPAFTMVPDLAKAIVQGLGDRKAANPNGPVPHIIHTSGTSNLADRPHSDPSRKLPYEFTDAESTKVYEMEKELNNKEPYPQRTCELTVTDTGLEVGIKTHVIMSPLIFGEGKGVGNKMSIQIPLLIGTALKDGYASYIGEGKEEWDHIHVSDLASLYTTVLLRIVEGKDVPSGKEGILFSETGRHSSRSVAENIVASGKKLGTFNGDVKGMPLEELKPKLPFLNPSWIELAFASNSRTKTVKAREWGWVPKWDEEAFKREFEGDWKAVLAKYGGGD